MQTRSMTNRAGVPHDLEAFNSYADEDFATTPTNTIITAELYEPPPMPTYDEVPEDIKAAFDPSHFCPSWVKCCEDNLARKPALDRSNAGGGAAHIVADKTTNTWSTLTSDVPPLPPLLRWCETLPTFRTRFTRSQWRLYIGEICHNISYEHANQYQLTTEEYAAAHDYMHGKL